MVEVHLACTKGEIFSNVDGMAGDSCQGVCRECATDTQVRRGADRM